MATARKTAARGNTHADDVLTDERPTRADRADSTSFPVAAFGDSLMWGQGLRREERFSWLIGTALAAAEGDQFSMVADRSRSGAQISATAEERNRFIETFPELFQNNPQRNRFRDGDEGRAEQLYGEIPATFPTVTWQVNAVSDEVGQTVKVALVSGGANDIGFDSVLNPQEFPGAFIEEFDGRIRKIAHDDVLGLLTQVRRKCPNAVILQFGYHRVLSYRSSKSDIKAWFKHEYGDDFRWWLNENVVHAVPVDQMVEEARIRSEWASGRGQHWIRQAVSDANASDTIRGPGVIFVPSGWHGVNSVFASRPLGHEDYTHPASDPAQADRQQAVSRLGELDRMRRLWLSLSLPNVSPTGQPVPPPTGAMRALREDLTGPEPLLAALDAAITDPLDGRVNGECLRQLRSEVSRIQRALIASFVHPNTAGAQRYADLAVDRYQAHVAAMARIRRDERRPDGPAQTPAPGGPESTDELLTRFGLRGPGTLRADVHHLDVDALTLIVVTERASDEHLAPEMSLVLNLVASRTQAATKEYRLNFPYSMHILDMLPLVFRVKKFYPHFEPAQTNRFCIPVAADLRLDQITGFSIHMGQDPLAGVAGTNRSGHVWRPRRVSLEINGRTVHDATFRGRALRTGDALKLAYPPTRKRRRGPVVVGAVAARAGARSPAAPT